MNRYTGKPTQPTGKDSAQHHGSGGHQHGPDGQHRLSGRGAPGSMTGQTGRTVSGAYVGEKSGGEQQMDVGTTSKDADISTTTGSAGPTAPGEKPGADDQR